MFWDSVADELLAYCLGFFSLELLKLQLFRFRLWKNKQTKGSYSMVFVGKHPTSLRSLKCSAYFPFFHLTFLPLNADKTYLLHFSDLQQGPSSAAWKDIVAQWPPKRNHQYHLWAACYSREMRGEDRVIMAKVSINTIIRLPSLPMGEEKDEGWKA